MKILHTESSGGFGGQEIRILREAEGMRNRGHEVIFAVREGGGLVSAARASGFVVYEVSFKKTRIIQDFFVLLRLIKRHQIEMINTHSSWDAWLGGIAARVMRRRVIRTRHLSTAIQKGLNSRLLYRALADQVVTTCETTAQVICQQAGLSKGRCRSIPTGVADDITTPKEAIDQFRAEHGLTSEHIVIGTVCVLRYWKGVQHMLQAAKLLENDSRLRWLIVGDGPSRKYLENECAELGLQNKVIFAGYHADPMPALAAMDIFTLLSTANEGVSQASLQAGLLLKPMVTTNVGGLGEVCINGVTGFVCPIAAPRAVADCVKKLANDEQLRQQMGGNARQLILSKFTLKHTLDGMEQVYGLLQQV